MKFELKKLGLILLIVFGIILIFTFIDYIVHSLSEEYAVPNYYYRNKIIFGTGIGFITYLFMSGTLKTTPFKVWSFPNILKNFPVKEKSPRFFGKFFLIQKKNPWIKALIFSGVVAVLLQTRYFLEGYPMKFVLEFLVFHFLMLLPISLLAFWLFRKMIR